MSENRARRKGGDGGRRSMRQQKKNNNKEKTKEKEKGRWKEKTMKTNLLTRKKRSENWSLPLIVFLLVIINILVSKDSVGDSAQLFIVYQD